MCTQKVSFERLLNIAVIVSRVFSLNDKKLDYRIDTAMEKFTIRYSNKIPRSAGIDFQRSNPVAFAGK